MSASSPGQGSGFGEPFVQHAAPSDDFVVVCEFHDSEGPVPAIVYPWNVHSRGFDQSLFAVRAMAVDPHERGRLSGLSIAHPSIQVCFPTQGRHVFAHHLHVLDFGARGYGRAVCVCYVTRDRHKIPRLFHSIRRHIARVASLLKEAALDAFMARARERLDRIRDMADDVEALLTTVHGGASLEDILRDGVGGPNTTEGAEGGKDDDGDGGGDSDDLTAPLSDLSAAGARRRLAMLQHLEAELLELISLVRAGGTRDTTTSSATATTAAAASAAAAAAVGDSESETGPGETLIVSMAEEMHLLQLDDSSPAPPLQALCASRSVDINSALERVFVDCGPSLVHHFLVRENLSELYYEDVGEPSPLCLRFGSIASNMSTNPPRSKHLVSPSLSAVSAPLTTDDDCDDGSGGGGGGGGGRSRKPGPVRVPPPLSLGEPSILVTPTTSTPPLQMRAGRQRPHRTTSHPHNISAASVSPSMSGTLSLSPTMSLDDDDDDGGGGGGGYDSPVSGDDEEKKEEQVSPSQSPARTTTTTTTTTTGAKRRLFPSGGGDGKPAVSLSPPQLLPLASEPRHPSAPVMRTSAADPHLHLDTDSLMYLLLHKFDGFAPHLVYSLLVGRPVLVCGALHERATVEAIVNALAALCPCLDRTAGIIPWLVPGSCDNSNSNSSSGSSGRSTADSSSSSSSIGRVSGESGGDDPAVDVTRNVTGTLRMCDVVGKRVVGLCSSVHVPASVLKVVSVLDVTQNVFSGPPYAARRSRATRDRSNVIQRMLTPHKSAQWRTPGVFARHVDHLLLELSAKVFLYFHLACAGLQTDPHPRPAQPKHQRGRSSSSSGGGLVNFQVVSPRAPGDGAAPQEPQRFWEDPVVVLERLSCSGCDAEVVCRLAELVKVQQTAHMLRHQHRMTVWDGESVLPPLAAFTPTKLHFRRPRLFTGHGGARSRPMMLRTAQTQDALPPPHHNHRRATSPRLRQTAQRPDRVVDDGGGGSGGRLRERRTAPSAASRPWDFGNDDDDEDADTPASSREPVQASLTPQKR